MKTITFCLTMCLAVLITLGFESCGGFGSKEKKGRESDEIAENAGDENLPGFLGDIKRAADQIEKQAKDMEEGKKVEVVNFRVLKDKLPQKAAGIPQTNSSGETTGVMGFKISKATAEYSDPDSEKRVEIEINDAGGISMLILGLAAWSTMEIDKEDQYGSERTTTFEGYKAYEETDTRQNTSSLTLIVDDRYIISLKGNNVDLDELKRIARRMDLDAFRSLG